VPDDMKTDTKSRPEARSFQSSLFASPSLRIGLIGGALGVLGGLVGVVVQLVRFHKSVGSIVVTLALYIGVVVIIVLVVWSTMRPSPLLKTGEPAKATVLKAWDTGVTVNMNPRIGLLLEVRPQGRAAYQTETTAVVSRLQAAWYVPGQVVDVRFDAKKPTRVALVDFAGAEPSPQAAAPTVDAEAIHRELDAYNERLLACGESARATIVRADPVGIMVRDNNPAVKFLLKVYPVGVEPFLAEAAGIISETAVAKYQPGCEIWVRFEATDKTRVGMDHS
jgi:hypothetical protein